MRELREEARPDRPRPDERHVAAQDVPELRDLVELRGLQPAADPRQLGVGAADELLAEVLPDARPRRRGRACGTSASGRSGRGARRARRGRGSAARSSRAATPAITSATGSEQEPEERSRRGCRAARSSMSIRAMRRLGREPRVPADEGVLERWRRGCHAVDGRPSACERSRDRPRPGRRAARAARTRRARSTAALLGLEELPKPEALRGRGGCWFRAGEQELHVGVEEPFTPARKAHPGFVVCRPRRRSRDRLRGPRASRWRQDDSIAGRRARFARVRPVRQPARVPPGLARARLAASYKLPLWTRASLRAFCAVVERKSFSQAAERLGVTQPAVSLQVRALEKRLGTQLLDRSGRRVEPTEAGLRLYRGAQRLLALEEQIVERARRGGDRRARRHVRDRRLDRARRDRALAAPLRVRRRAPGAPRRSERLRHADGRRARRRPRARARRRRRRAAPPRRRVRAVLPRRGDPRLPAGPPVRRARR